MALLDTGLAARLGNVSAAGAGPESYGEIAGHLLEAFVASEIRKQQGWSEETVQLSHFRGRAAGEVDIVLETPDGRVAGIEVKSTASLSRGDNKWLSQLRDRLGRRFVGGLVLYTGMTTTPFGERLAAAPMDVLWAS